MPQHPNARTAHDLAESRSIRLGSASVRTGGGGWRMTSLRCSRPPISTFKKIYKVDKVFWEQVILAGACGACDWHDADVLSDVRSTEPLEMQGRPVLRT